MALYSAKQLAAMLNVSAYTIQALIRAGEFGETVNVARQHLVTKAARTRGPRADLKSGG